MAARPEFSQIAPNFGQRCQEPRRLSTSKTRGQLRIESPTPMGNTLRADNLPWGSRKQHARPLSLPPMKRQPITTESRPYTNFSLERELGRRRRASSQSGNESMQVSMGSLVDLDALSVEVCHPAFHMKEDPCTHINTCQDVDETGRNKNETQQARTYMSPSKLYLHL
jgi:hypothetical protein